MTQTSTATKALYKMVFTALMAAIVFVTTYFIKIDIPTPVGPTMLKSGNIFCLLAGLLFGGIPGGLAAGIGSMLYDLLDPRFAPEAWITFIRFFLMGAICGLIAHAGKAGGRNTKLNVVAVIAASLFSFLFYIVKSIAVLVLAGSAFVPAVVACSAKMVTSGINAVLSIILSLVLLYPLRLALERSGVAKKLG